MIVKDFIGYKEGRDVSKIPLQNLAYPSKNMLVLKGKAYVRPGIANDGFAATGSTGVLGEYVWKDSKSGEHALRAAGTALQLKKAKSSDLTGQWFDIYNGIDSDAARVRFSTWVDGNGSILKKRLAFVDGSANLHQWNGAVGIVASYDGGTNTATLDSAASTALLRGFDPGNANAQTAVVVRFNADGTVAGTEEKTYINDCSGNTIVFSGSLTDAPAAGDLIIAKPKAYTNLSTTLKDDVYSFKNHLVVAGLNSVRMNFSHIEDFDVQTGWTFTVPGLGSRTAHTAIQIELAGNYTAMIARKNVLWASTADGWVKMTKLLEENAYGSLLEIEDFPQAERKGALPFAVANYKGDIVHLSQDKTLHRVFSNELVGTDTLEILSDDVEDLLLRLNMAEVRLYYESRYIWIVCPAESTVLMLDMVGDPERGIGAYWNPPQIVPCSYISIIGGVRYGHHNSRAETFTLFSGTNDLGVAIEAVYAPGYHSGEHELKYKTHETIGMSHRISSTTKATVRQYFETDGEKASDEFIIDGATAKTYDAPEDISFGILPWASVARGGASETTALRRSYSFSKYSRISYFEHRPVITITSRTTEEREAEFQLLAWWIDQRASQEKTGDDLYISRDI